MGVAADENHSQVQQVVSEERADAKTTQTEENNSTEDNRVAEQKGYLAFETTTVNKAESDKQSALGECKASFKARSELIAGDQKLLNEIAPLLAKLKACKGSTSLLEIELAKASSLDSMSCAAAAERYQEITTQTSLLETTEAAPTDGNLASFSARVGEENIEATRVRDECNKAANDSFASKKAAAATLKTDRNTKSDGDAKDATDQTNLQFETTSTALDARYKAAKDPWVIATGLDLLAQTASEKSAAELAAALAAQKKEVTAGTALHLQIKTEATALRKNNIAADRIGAEKAGVSCRTHERTSEGSQGFVRYGPDLHVRGCGKHEQSTEQRESQRRGTKDFMPGCRCRAPHHHGQRRQRLLRRERG